MTNILSYGLNIDVWRADSPKLDESLLLGGLCRFEEVDLGGEKLRGVDAMVGEDVLGCLFGLRRL